MTRLAASAAAILCLVAGAGAGFAAGRASVEPRHSDVYEALDAKFVRAIERRRDAEEEAQQVQRDLQEALRDIPAREAAVEASKQEAQRVERQLDERQGRLTRRLSAVERRERAVGLVERTIARNTLAGDGVFRVGKDMRAGTYRTTGGTGPSGQCYWSINADANGANIIQNGLGSGPSLATVSDGQFFETSMCKNWVLQN